VADSVPGRKGAEERGAASARVPLDAATVPRVSRRARLSSVLQVCEADEETAKAFEEYHDDDDSDVENEDEDEIGEVVDFGFF